MICREKTKFIKKSRDSAKWSKVQINKKRSLDSSFLLLTDKDSNLDKQNQNLLCYRYTIGQKLYFAGSGCKVKICI